MQLQMASAEHQGKRLEWLCTPAVSLFEYAVTSWSWSFSDRYVRVIGLLLVHPLGAYFYYIHLQAHKVGFRCFCS